MNTASVTFCMDGPNIGSSMIFKPPSVAEVGAVVSKSLSSSLYSSAYVSFTRNSASVEFIMRL